MDCDISSSIEGQPVLASALPLPTSPPPPAESLADPSSPPLTGRRAPSKVFLETEGNSQPAVSHMQLGTSGMLLFVSAA